MPEQRGLSFAALLRRLRAEAGLTQEELAEAASLSPRSVSDLERGINRTARKDTALLLADALGLAGPAREVFVAVARGQAPARELLLAPAGVAASFTRNQGELASLLRAVIDSPYRGLAAFSEEDAALFFGRETAATQVLERLSRHLEGPGLVAVSGASGAGKSSLLRAGVLPRIRGAGLGSVPGSESWACLLLTPTHAPLDELALRVALLAGGDAAAVRRGLDTAPEGFALTARQAALARPRGPGHPQGAAAQGDQPLQPRLLLVVDQFEELFTQCADEGQRRAFIAALHAAATAGHGPGPPQALVVLGVRADFEARCAEYPQLAGAVQDRYLVTPMTERQLRMAITEPARKVGSQVDDDLVEVLLTEVRARQPGISSAGMLPLLSHALDQAWRSRTGTTLTLADYERTGGIEGAVADSAQRAYERLTPAQQAAARQIFTRLTAISSEGLDTADRATRAGLTEGKNAAQIRDVEAVLEAFTAERLLTLAADTVEISHEVLLTAWPLLRDSWLTETHADRLVRTRLHTTADEWARHSRDPSYLYAGSLLQSASETAARAAADPARNPPLNRAEREFLHASGRARRRRARGRRAVIAGLLTLTLAAISAAAVAASNAANATRQHALALSRQLAAESLATDSASPVIARRLAVAAWRVSPTDQAGSAMTALLAEQQQDGILPADPASVNGLAFSPDGRLLASADDDGTVRLWNPATRQPVGAPLHADPKGTSAVAFSPDGKLLASADDDGTVRLWNPATRQPVGALGQASSRPQGGVTAVAFSPDGKLLAGAEFDGTVRLWNPATRQHVGAPLQTGSGPQGLAVAFSPDGKLLASADGIDGAVRLWNPATGRPVGAPIQADPSGVFGVAFSPDGRLLASAGGDGTVRLWNLATGQPVGGPLHPTGAQNALAAGVAFSPDGKLLAITNGDGTVRLWNPATGQPLGAPIRGDPSGVYEVAVSPDGRLLASAGGDGTVRLWNLATGQPVGGPLQIGSQADQSDVAFSPDGKLLATADGGDGTVQLWNLVTRQPIGAPIQADPHDVYTVAFSPDGKLLASEDINGVLRLWSVATRLPVGAPIQQAGVVGGMVFSPDSKLLAAPEDIGTVRLWNAATGQPVGGLLHASGAQNPPAVGVAFSPDGKLLAITNGSDGTVQLWNPVTRQPVGAPLQTGSGHQGISDVAFSPDGSLLATTSLDGTVQLWDTSLLTNPYAALCADVGPPTTKEWATYAPGEPQPKICA